jgi:hypothetical protein
MTGVHSHSVQKWGLSDHELSFIPTGAETIVV